MDIILICCSDYANGRITLCCVLMVQNTSVVGSKFLSFWKSRWIKNKRAKQGPLVFLWEKLCLLLFHSIRCLMLQVLPSSSNCIKE